MGRKSKVRNILLVLAVVNYLGPLGPQALMSRPIAQPIARPVSGGGRGVKAQQRAAYKRRAKRKRG